MAVSNCINLRSHIRQRLFKTHPYSASCIVGNASGRCNQSHWSREEELIIYWSHALFSIAPLPISNTASSVPIPLFSNFLISAFSHHPSHFLFFRTTHCQTSFFLVSHIWRWTFSSFLLCGGSERQKGVRMLLFTFTEALFLQLYYYITTGLGMDDYCQVRRLGSVYLPEMVTPMVLSRTVRVYGSFRSKSRVIVASVRACCSASCWTCSHAGWCVG